MPPVHGTLHARSFVAAHADLIPLAPHVVHAVHGALPDDENSTPATQGILHTASAFLVQAVFSPAAPHAWHPTHGALPDADHVGEVGGAAAWHVPPRHPGCPISANPQQRVSALHSLPVDVHATPAVHGIFLLHTASAFLVQAVFSPAAPHAWHPTHGALPDADHVAPAAHGTLHTRSFVASHSDLAPLALHFETSMHAVHGSKPDSENVLPATQGVLHTALAFMVQSDFVDATSPQSRHALHGALPDAENVEPASHSHTVSDVWVQAVLTFAPPQVVHVSHGVDPTILYAVAQEGSVRALHSPLEHAQDCVAVGT